MLSSSERVYAPPNRMTAHGRAAWGACTVAFDSDGVFVDGNIAYIDPERFGLPEAASIVISDEAFCMSDGRSGVESFTHGGVFPEEVLIPWLQFTRDRSPLKLSIRLTGLGRAGAAGKMRLEIINTSEVRIEIIQVQLSLPQITIDSTMTVAPLQRSAAEWSIAVWPQSQNCLKLKRQLFADFQRVNERFFVLSQNSA